MRFLISKRRLIFISSLLFAVVLLACSCSRQDKSNEKEEGTTAKSVTTTTENLPTMLELGSHGCKSCEAMKPVVASLEKKHHDKLSIIFHDVKRDRAIAQKYKIKLIPTQVFLTAEGKEFFRHEGFYSEQEIEEVFRKMGVNI